MPNQDRSIAELEDCCVLDSITHLKREIGEVVVVAGSHCGAYSARYALQFQISAIILNDAGVGKDRAGISGLGILGRAGIPAAAIAHLSARIGDGADCLARGVISHCNGLASDLGVTINMPAREAIGYLRGSKSLPRLEQRIEKESRHSIAIPGGSRAVIITDSASLVGPGDEGAVIVTGSHGGLLGGRPETAMKADVFAALFNDAGVGAEDAGISRLPALDARRIAAATVDAWSARIGEAQSTYEEGVLSHVNETASRIGACAGMTARAFVELAATSPA